MRQNRSTSQGCRSYVAAATRKAVPLMCAVRVTIALIACLSLPLAAVYGEPVPAADVAPTEYTLGVKNCADPGDVAVFQKDPDIGVSNVFSLAWFTKYAFRGEEANFSWGIDYSFVWDRTGILKPGLHFDASQNPGAGLDAPGPNFIQLEYDTDDQAYHFTKMTYKAPPKKKTLIVHMDSSVPNPRRNPDTSASVGIGMSGAGTFVVQAEPRKTVVFTPHPTYWIVVGTFKAGQVLDIEQLEGAVQEVEFDGVTDESWTLTSSNKWVHGTHECK